MERSAGLSLLSRLTEAPYFLMRSARCHRPRSPSFCALSGTCACGG